MVLSGVQDTESYTENISWPDAFLAHPAENAMVGA